MLLASISLQGTSHPKQISTQELWSCPSLAVTSAGVFAVLRLILQQQLHGDKHQHGVRVLQGVTDKCCL